MMGGSGPPTTKAEYLRNPIPNPQMQEALKDFQEKDILMFGMSQPELFEDQDKDEAQKSLTQLAKYLTFGSLFGVLINVQIKKVPYINFLNWNRVIRYFVRIPLFTLPFLLTQNIILDKKASLEQIQSKYWVRIQNFQKTGDMRSLDPNALLFEKFQSKKF